MRELARFNYLPLVFVPAFAPFQQLAAVRSLACTVLPRLGLFGLFACLSVCLSPCLSASLPVSLFVCLSVRLHFTAVKQLNLSRRSERGERGEQGDAERSGTSAAAESRDCSLLSVDCAFQLARNAPTMIIEINFLCKMGIIADVVGD